MPTLALYVLMSAKLGKEQDVADFLRGAQSLVDGEPGTRTWYAFQESPSRFAIFDTFDDEAGRDAHLNGDVAKALMAKADELFSESPTIQKLDILASKVPPSRS